MQRLKIIMIPKCTGSIPYCIGDRQEDRREDQDGRGGVQRDPDDQQDDHHDQQDDDLAVA